MVRADSRWKGASPSRGLHFVERGAADRDMTEYGVIFQISPHLFL